MGLNTSHGCWNGAYSAFHRWRERLWQLARPEEEHVELLDTQQYSDRIRSNKNIVDILGKDNPLIILFCHSDCDGEISAAEATILAPAMRKLLDKMPARALYDDVRPATERFIKGLELAASRGEAVIFS